MTTATRTAGKHRTALFALDPYLIDECTFTRGEILRARGLVPAARVTRRTRTRPCAARARGAARR